MEGCQNAAYLRLAVCRLYWPSAIKSTSLCIARNSVKGALRDPFQARSASTDPNLEPGTIPSQAGTSCEAGASTARTRDGQPSTPESGETAVVESVPGGVDAGHPAVPAPKSSPQTPTASKAIPPHGSHLQGAAANARSLRESRAGPSRAFAESKAGPSHRHSHTRSPQTPQQLPPDKTTLGGLAPLCSPSM